KPLEKLIEKKLDVAALRASGRNFAVGTVSLVSGLYKEWTPSENDFIKKLLASASIPVVFPYVDFEDVDVLVDGGVRNITPLSSAFEQNPDEIYVLLTSRVEWEGADLHPSGVQEHDYDQWDDNWLGTKVSGFDVLKRTVEILSDEVYLDDIRTALHWNDIAQAVDDLTEIAKNNEPNQSVKNGIEQLKAVLGKVKKRHVKLNVIAPREWYGDTNSSTEFSRRLIAWAIAHGHEVAADKNRWV
ncbi:MAG: hypothetical protein O7G88_14890, partial [bacterium]|nr:hypothetical protein [bacterium]